MQDNGLTGHHTANIGLVPIGSDGWRVWTIATILETFEGYGHPDEPQLIPSDRKVLLPDGLDYSVAIIGGGQCGIAHAGRLKAIIVPAIVIEKAPEVGHAWTSRYDSIRQHTFREYNNLPFGQTWKLKMFTSNQETLLRRVTLGMWRTTRSRYGYQVNRRHASGMIKPKRGQ